MRPVDLRASFEEFVHARGSSLLRTAFLLTGQDRAEAEDLLQVVLERAYRHWARVCETGEPERYVRRILANASADRWRRLHRHPEQSLPAAEAGLSVPDQAADIADRDYLLRALAALPPRQRAVLVLRYYDDMSEAEIAEALGCSIGTVKSQLARGLARMREAAEPAATPAGGQGGAADD